MSIAATAQHGRFLATDDPDTILFRLEKGRPDSGQPAIYNPAHARL